MLKRGKLGKKAIVVETLIWWVIAIAVLVIVIILAVILKDKLWEIWSYLKGVFRGG